MDDYKYQEMLNTLNNIREEVSLLRKEVSSLKNEVHSKKISQTWMDLKEAAGYLHLSVSTMKNRIAGGEFPWAIKKHRKWMFPTEELKRYASNINQ